MRISNILFVSTVFAFALNSGSSGFELGAQKRHEGHHEEQPSAVSHPMNGTMAPSPATMSHSHGRPILEDPHLEPQQRKYWEQYSTLNYFTSEDGSKFWLWCHALLVITSLGMLSPLTLIMSNSSHTQWFYVPLETVKMVVTVASAICLAFYSASAPDLYPGNVYGRFYALFVLLSGLHWLSMIIKSITTYISKEGLKLHHGYEPAIEMEEGNSPDLYAVEDEREGYGANQLEQQQQLNSPRESSISATEFGSGSETELSSFDADRDLPKHSLNSHSRNWHEFSNRDEPPLLVQKLAKNKIFTKLNSLMGGVFSFTYHLLNYPMFFVNWTFLLLGLATGFCIGKGHSVFALLAHFIKGFVFVLVGFMELARYLGVGAKRGWAWNEIFILKDSKACRSSKLYIAHYIFPKLPTIEYMQCFLIFFYGSTNIFLEHLGNNTNGAWSHKDLQHISIAFMFLGGGICGLIFESDTVKRFVAAASGARLNDTGDNNLVRRGWSLNPMPAFIIFWTGALMSKHQQETELSTQIHVQWGTLLSLAAAIRLCTLAIMMVKPRPGSACEGELPQQPFTEILVAFCLICGGTIFMGSNRETVEAMIYRGIDQMFTLNVSVGFTVILMAYFTGCIALKGWANARYRG